MKLCTTEEWEKYEPKILAKMGKAWASERLKIRMYRKDHEEALSILLEMGPPGDRYGSGYNMEVAAQLERMFPDKILEYYRSGLGSLNVNMTRKEYAAKAAMMEKVRHMYVDVLKMPEEWETFARRIKRDNVRRSALQEEFAMRIHGWKGID